jgi:hypothetical protein
VAAHPETQETEKELIDKPPYTMEVLTEEIVQSARRLAAENATQFLVESDVSAMGVCFYGTNLDGMVDPFDQLREARRVAAGRKVYALVEVPPELVERVDTRRTPYDQHHCDECGDPTCPCTEGMNTSLWEHPHDVD